MGIKTYSNVNLPILVPTLRVGADDFFVVLPLGIFGLIFTIVGFFSSFIFFLIGFPMLIGAVYILSFARKIYKKTGKTDLLFDIIFTIGTTRKYYGRRMVDDEQ